MKLVPIFIGIFIFVILGFFEIPNKLDRDSWLIARVLIVMTIWWLTECIPLSVTALLPLIVIPPFSEIDIYDVVKPYSNPVIFLLLGGFIIGLGFQKSQLHKRIAMLILSKIGSSEKSILAGFILASSFLSMWLSNTATCLLMLPVAISVISKMNLEPLSFFKKILILSIAYSSSIGGMATLIGTAPNAIFAGFLNENYAIEISFLSWLMFGVPLSIILLSILWTFCCFLISNKSSKKIDNSFFVDEFKKLGKIGKKEKITILIMILTVLLWIFKFYINTIFNINLSDAGIAIFGAFLFFVLPYGKNNFLLENDWVKNIPWNILILFGGGLSIASLVSSSGLADWISDSFFVFDKNNVFFIILFLALIISFMTEITSNTATILLFLPIISSFAVQNELNIILILLPIVLASSCAFMMPIATPPNAIVYSTGEISISFMVKIGVLMNLVAVLISSIWIYFFSNLLNI